MKVYQIHECGGCYDDSYDYIQFTYLDKAKAETMKRELEAQELIDQKCSTCPLWYCPDNCVADCDKCLSNDSARINSAKEYCDMCDASFDEEHEVECKNKALHYDDSNFRIEEIDVIE